MQAYYTYLFCYLVFIFSPFCNSFFIWYSSFGMCLLFIFQAFFHRFALYLTFNFRCFTVSSFIWRLISVVSSFRRFVLFVLLCFFHTHAYNNYKYKRRVKAYTSPLKSGQKCWWYQSKGTECKKAAAKDVTNADLYSSM